MSWDNGKLTKATIQSKLGNPCKLKVGDQLTDLQTKPGESYAVEL
jgi:hypothetical protein